MMTACKTIKMCQRDCTTVTNGLFVSGENGDVDIYEILLATANGGKYLPNEAVHTICHLFSTFIEKSAIEENSIIGFFPLPCRTGFSLLTKEISPDEVLLLVKDFFRFVIAYSGKIPRRNLKECANYIEHSLEGAKAIAALGDEILKSYTVDMMKYS